MAAANKPTMIRAVNRRGRKRPEVHVCDGTWTDQVIAHILGGDRDRDQAQDRRPNRLRAALGVMWADTMATSTMALNRTQKFRNNCTYCAKYELAQRSTPSSLI